MFSVVTLLLLVVLLFCFLARVLLAELFFKLVGLLRLHLDNHLVVPVEHLFDLRHPHGNHAAVATGCVQLVAEQLVATALVPQHSCTLFQLLFQCGVVLGVDLVLFQEPLVHHGADGVGYDAAVTRFLRHGRHDGFGATDHVGRALRFGTAW